MTGISSSRDLQLYGGKRKKNKSGYKLKDLTCFYKSCTDADHFALSLEEYFYEVFCKKELCEDEATER